MHLGNGWDWMLVALHAGLEVQCQGCVGQQQAAVGASSPTKAALCVHWAGLWLPGLGWVAMIQSTATF